MAVVLKRGLRAAPVTHRIASEEIAVHIQRGGVELIKDVAFGWSRLCDTNPGSTPFMRPEWYSIYLQTIEPNAKVVLVSARRNGSLIAILPFIEERTRFSGVPLTLLRPVGSRTSPARFELIHAPAERDAAIAAIWDALRNSREWGLIEMADIPQDGALEQLVYHAETDGGLVAHRVARRTPYVMLPDCLDEMMKRVRGDFRRNTTRRLRKLKTLGDVQFFRYDTYDAHRLQQFFALEASGWKGQAGTSISSNPAEVAYYEALARAAAAGGYFRMYVMEFDGHPIAMHFGLCLNGTYSIPKTAYDERFHEFAPGHLILQESLRDSIAEGLHELDFLGHEMEWKRSWTSDLRIHQRYFIFNKSLAASSAYLLRFRVLPAGKRATKSTRAMVARGLDRSPSVSA